MARAAIAYEVRVADLHAHLFQVRLTVQRPAGLQQLSLPVWIPGSYLVREFSKNLQQLQARQGSKTLALKQLDKCSWQVQCTEGKPLVLDYQVYAFDSSVRTAWLDSTRGFFNGTSVFLRVLGQEDVAHALTLLAEKKLPNWHAGKNQPKWFWQLPGRRLRRTGGLAGGVRRVLERLLRRLRRATPFCRSRCAPRF